AAGALPAADDLRRAEAARGDARQGAVERHRQREGSRRNEDRLTSSSRRPSDSMTYLDKNRALWNARVAAHVNSDFYDMAGFRAGKSSLKPPELRLLGDLSGKSVLHLQCHFGQDTLSLARMGAEVTGLDFSDEAIRTARALAEELQLPASFVCGDLYDAPALLQRQYDVVFTSYGVIGWLPDLNRWAEVVASCLKPGGRFVFAEFHPVVWMLDDELEF